MNVDAHLDTGLVAPACLVDASIGAKSLRRRKPGGGVPPGLPGSSINEVDLRQSVDLRLGEDLSHVLV